MRLRVSLSGISSVLFHTTTIDRLSKILKGNKFVLSSSARTQIEDRIREKQGHYYLSTSRTRRSRFNGGNVSSLGCLITLDGTKLSNNYKGKAIDYHNIGRKGRRESEPYEQEDRIFSKKPVIPNAKKYILEVSLFYDGANKNSPIYDQRGFKNYVREYRQLLLTLKTNKIPYYIYSDKGAYFRGETSKAININMKALNVKDKRKREVPHASEHIEKQTKETLAKERGTAGALAELFHKKSKKELSKYALAFLTSTQIGSQPISEIVKIISNSLNDNNSSPKGMRSVEAIIAKTGSKHKLARLLKNKWNQTRE